MSLLNHGALFNHPVIIELLHDVQLSASIRDPKLGLECIPHIFSIINSRISINYVLTKNTQESSLKQSIHFLKSLCLLSIKLSFRFAESGVIATHGLKP